MHSKKQQIYQISFDIYDRNDTNNVDISKDNQQYLCKQSKIVFFYNFGMELFGWLYFRNNIHSSPK